MYSEIMWLEIPARYLYPLVGCQYLLEGYKCLEGLSTFAIW